MNETPYHQRTTIRSDQPAVTEPLRMALCEAGYSALAERLFSAIVVDNDFAFKEADGLIVNISPGRPWISAAFHKAAWLTMEEHEAFVKAAALVLHSFEVP